MDMRFNGVFSDPHCMYLGPTGGAGCTQMCDLPRTTLCTRLCLPFLMLVVIQGCLCFWTRTIRRMYEIIMMSVPRYSTSYIKTIAYILGTETVLF